MRTPARVLINTPDIELWPADLLRARGNHDARVLARARWLLRRKADGRYLAAALDAGLMPLLPRWTAGLAVDAALDALDHAPDARRHGMPRGRTLPPQGLQARLAGLGVDADDYAARTGLLLVAEPLWLDFAGLDRFRRPLWLEAGTAGAWSRMQRAAGDDGVALDAISGYRSHDYQLGIFARKQARGQSLDAVLAVNAAPGFSEHHSGRALDIGTPGDPPAEASFEGTDAFAWLRAQAGAHGFVMSYPRDNPHGFIYEPWHWRFDGATGEGAAQRDA